jgi:hypothetical protein
MHRTNPAPNRTGFLYVAWVYCQIPVLYASVSDRCHLLAASRSGEVSSEDVVQAQQAQVRCWDSLDSVLQSEDQKPAPKLFITCVWLADAKNHYLHQPVAEMQVRCRSKGGRTAEVGVLCLC